MKLTVLVDNHTLTDHYLLAEPGVCFYIEEGDYRFLFDVGYSDVFIHNARQLQIDLYQLDGVAISHGHLDHTWGFTSMVRLYTEALLEKISFKEPQLFAHPHAFDAKYFGKEFIGSLIGERTLHQFFDIQYKSEPHWLTDKLVFLGEIPRSNSFENQNAIGCYMNKGECTEDFVIDDSAIVYKAEKGLVIVTGCSHVGICNIIDYAKKVCGDLPILDIIGGFHLLDASEEYLNQTLEYLKHIDIRHLHPCHCTGLKATIALSKIIPVDEVGVGLKLEYK